jgi:carboxylate-amine ligase
MSESAMDFKKSDALTLGVELELQLLSQRDFDLTRGATDLLSDLKYDGGFGDVKLEITESMIEVSTLARATVDEIAADLEGLRKTLIDQCARNNIAICGGGTHPFHAWPERRICPSDRFDAVYQRYGYLAKQFTVFGQHVHVGCETADDAIWLTQALGPYVPIFIALSASSPYVDGVDTFFQSARLNAVSAFPLSGQCPEVADWAGFVEHFEFLKDCGIVSSIKDLYWDIRPKPEFGTVEIRVCDTPLSI